MRDFIVEDKCNRARVAFVESIDTEAVCRLASSFHNNEPCEIFRPAANGSFNACFFVAFAHIKWVVRFPIPYVNPWVDEKLEVEVATVKYVSENTTIPVPRVHGYAFTQESPMGLAFVIMDYVEGKTLRELGFSTKEYELWFFTPERCGSRRKALYDGLAHIYTELRQLEFPQIGALGFDPNDGSVCVRNRPLTMQLAIQESEGLDPTARLPPGKTFSAASEFVDMMLWLGDNLMDKGPNAMDGRRERLLFAFAAFRRHITEKWLDPSLDKGPFVLMHGDLNKQNLLWDDSMQLVAVLDWEWSAVVPLSCFIPPWWLIDYPFRALCQSYDFHLEEMHKLNTVIRARQAQRGGVLLDWSRQEEHCDALVLRGLWDPDFIDDIYWSHLSYIEAGFRYVPRGDSYKRYKALIDRWMAEFTTDEQRAFVERKKKQAFAYYDEEKAYFEANPKSDDGETENSEGEKNKSEEDEDAARKQKVSKEVAGDDKGGEGKKNGESPSGDVVTELVSGISAL